MSEARLILTCGLPGAGKSTLVRQLAAGRSALPLTKDGWLWALGSNPWNAPTQKNVEHELWQLAQEVLRLGLGVFQAPDAAELALFDPPPESD